MEYNKTGANDWSMEYPTLSIDTHIQGNIDLYMDEVQEIVIEELKKYCTLLIEFEKDPPYEDVDKNKPLIKHIKGVLKAYMDRQEYKDFIKSL
jgi:di/tripeptidase